jgi:hypothetical protein
MERETKMIPIHTPQGEFQSLGAALRQQSEQTTVVIAWEARYNP